MHHSAKCPSSLHTEDALARRCIPAGTPYTIRCYLICVLLLPAPSSVQISLPQLWELCVNVTLSSFVHAIMGPNLHTSSYHCLLRTIRQLHGPGAAENSQGIVPECFTQSSFYLSHRHVHRHCHGSQSDLIKLWQSTSSSLATVSSFFLAGPWGFSVGVDFINEFLQLILRQFLHPLLRRAKICLRCWKHSETLWRPTISLNWRPKTAFSGAEHPLHPLCKQASNKNIFEAARITAKFHPCLCLHRTTDLLEGFHHCHSSFLQALPSFSMSFLPLLKPLSQETHLNSVMQRTSSRIKRLSRACRIWESHAAGDKQWVLLQSKHVHFDGLLQGFSESKIHLCRLFDGQAQNVVDLQTLNSGVTSKYSLAGISWPEDVTGEQMHVPVASCFLNLLRLVSCVWNVGVVSYWQDRLIDPEQSLPEHGHSGQNKHGRQYRRT